MNLKSLTENRYTLNDIFVKNSEGWLAVALLMYPLAHIVHIIVYTFLFKETMNFEQLLKALSTYEYPGDYFAGIINCFFTISLLVGIVGIITKLIYEKRNKTLINSDKSPGLFFLVFLILACISIALNGISRELFFGLTPRGEAFLSILMYFFYYFAGSLIRKEKIKYYILYFILGLGLVNGAMTLVNEYVWEIPIANHPHLCSVYYNINFYAYFLTILIMLSAALILKDENKGRKAFAFISLCLNSYVLALNNTFGCFVACFLAFIIMIIADSVIRKKFSFSALGLFGVFLTICMITSLFVESFFTQLLTMFTDLRLIIFDEENADDAGTLRWGLWRNTMRYIREKPWIGFGFEGIAERLDSDAGQDKVHNEYLEYAADFGLPAVLCYISGLIAIYIKALKKRALIDGATFCALVAAFGYIGSAFFGNTMVFIAPLFFIVLGLANAIGSEPDVIPSVAEEATETEADESEILRLASLAQDDTPCHSESAEESGVNETEETEILRLASLAQDDTNCHSELVEESDVNETEETEILQLASLVQDDNNVATPQDDNVCHSEPAEESEQ